MRNDYLKEYKLSDLYKMDSGLNSTKEQAGHGANFLSFRDIYNNYILPDTLTEKMDTTKEEQNKYSIKKGDIFLTRTSEVIDELAMSSVAIKDYPNSTFSGFAKRLRPIQNDITYDKFMAFFLRSKYFRRIINNKAFMTLRASFNDNIFQDIKILIPNYETQVKIGNLFYNIECKIRYNNQINNNLEDMIKTLYQRWFMEFEFPNDEGNPYKSSSGRMVWNEDLKQEIPENWSSNTIKSLCDVISGYPFSKDTYNSNGKYKLITIKNVQDEGINLNTDNNIKDIPSNMPDYCLLKPLNILMSLTGNVGRVGIMYSNNCLLNQRVAILKEKNKEQIPFIYSLFKNDYIRKRLENISTGTSQLNLSPIETEKLKIPYNEKIINNYCNITFPYILKIEKILEENQKLIELRDYLLPMLMNGQINVDDIEI